MAGLIPIILVLSIALYLFPDASGLKTEITAPILNQTDNSSLNQSSLNTSETQADTSWDSEHSRIQVMIITLPRIIQIAILTQVTLP